jgi:hypothetical protein
MSGVVVHKSAHTNEGERPGHDKDVDRKGRVRLDRTVSYIVTFLKRDGNRNETHGDCGGPRNESTRLALTRRCCGNAVVSNGHDLPFDLCLFRSVPGYRFLHSVG